MKMILGGLVAAALLCAGVVDAMAIDKVVITAAKKPVDSTKGKVGEAGSKAKDSESIYYQLTFQNQTLADLPQVTVNYIIFVERQKLGQKLTDPGHVDRITGSQNIDVLTNRAPQSVSTSEITLNKENLVGHYHYASGGRIKAEDNIAGVWVRVLQNDQIIAEFANPPSVTKRGWDAK